MHLAMDCLFTLQLLLSRLTHMVECLHSVVVCSVVEIGKNLYKESRSFSLGLTPFQFAMGLLLCTLVIAFVIFNLSYASDLEGCLRPTRLGCFEAVSPWTTILRPLPPPLEPELINTQARLYTRSSFQQGDAITLWPHIKIPNKFDNSKKTYVIVHGFIDNGNKGWQLQMAQAILKKKLSNIIIIDWGKGAVLLNYLQVAANTRIVAAEITRLLMYLITKGANPVDFHLIGHSLGAHICGYVGKEIYGIGRITGLDPAQPAFEGYDLSVRLTESDAIFIDVIHTDARPFIPLFGFGMIAPVGDVDFYINGGFDQPGCLNVRIRPPNINSLYDLASIPFENIYEFISCPHERAYHYFTSAILSKGNCTFWGKKTNLIGSFASKTGFFDSFFAKWFTCTKKNCSPIGLDTDYFMARGSFFVKTSDKIPFCNADQEADRIMSKYGYIS